MTSGMKSNKAAPAFNVMMRYALVLTFVLLLIAGCGKGDDPKASLVPVVPLKQGTPAALEGLNVSFVGYTWNNKQVVTKWRVDAKGDKPLHSLSWGDFRGESFSGAPEVAGCTAQTLPEGFHEPKSTTLQTGEGEDLAYCWQVAPTLTELNVSITVRPLYPVGPTNRMVISIRKAAPAP